MLPINEMPPSESSPYSALSAMAIDPQFITVDDVEDFNAIGGEQSLETEHRSRLDAVRLSRTIDYQSVRSLKRLALKRAFAHFVRTEWAGHSSRASRFRAYRLEQAWWLDEYALFRTLHSHYGERLWMEWPESVRDRHPEAIARARIERRDDILFRQYVQWIASEQWSAARAQAGDVDLLGDLPFVVSADSADVWARQDEFRLDLSVGVPPDAFSATGQDWGLPAYRWDVVSMRDFEWLRHRARRYVDVFTGFRIDHLVGFYRMYTRPIGKKEGTFTPATQPEQVALGERILGVFRETGAEIIAEDLGVIPDFVRESLARLAIPGYRVFRWERKWHDAGQPFKDPARYPAVSVATSGTHDTEPMVSWWEAASAEEKQAVLEIPSIRDRLGEAGRARAYAEREMSDDLRHAILESLIASSADLVILPIQDVFGWRERINQPATVGDHNWSWKLPWFSDHLSRERQALEVAERLSEWSRRYQRL